MRKTFIIAGLALGVSSIASAQTFYATNNLAGTNGYTSGGDQLITYDFQTAAWAPVSGTGEIIDQSGRARNGIGGLDFNGNGTILYGIDTFGVAPGDVMTIDPATGAATVIGNIGVGLNDLAWDPITNDLYGVDGSGNVWANVDDPANAVNVGNNGLGGLEVGMGFDSRGNVYYHGVGSDQIHAGALLTPALLHTVPFNSNFSQGLFVDWGNGDNGYHGALDGGALNSPNHEFGSLVTGGPYNAVASSIFATDAGTGLPEVEVGDLTRPVPAPATIALMGLGGLAATRRRR